MNVYTVQARVTAWPYIKIEAETEEQALEIANQTPWSEWTLDIDFSSVDSPEVIEEEVSA